MRNEIWKIVDSTSRLYQWTLQVGSSGDTRRLKMEECADEVTGEREVRQLYIRMKNFLKYDLKKWYGFTCKMA